MPPELDLRGIGLIRDNFAKIWRLLHGSRLKTSRRPGASKKLLRESKQYLQCPGRASNFIVETC